MAWTGCDSKGDWQEICLCLWVRIWPEDLGRKILDGLLKSSQSAQLVTRAERPEVFEDNNEGTGVSRSEMFKWKSFFKIWLFDTLVYQGIIQEMQAISIPTKGAVVWSLSHAWLSASQRTVARKPPVHGISQARILEWDAISFSRGSSQPRDQTRVTCTGRQILYCWATSKAPPLR